MFNSDTHSKAAYRIIIIPLFSLVLSNALNGQEYPAAALLDHQQLHGNMQSVVDLDPAIFIERAILTLDFIETNPENRQAHLTAFQSYLLPVLLEMSESDSGYDATLIASVNFRYQRLVRPPPLFYPVLPGESNGGGSSASSYSNYTVSQVDDCSQFDYGFRQYCNDSAFQTFIVAEVRGGNSTHYEDLEEYLRTMNWARYANQDELNQALANAGIESGLITQFSNDFSPQGNVDLLQKFRRDESLISENPDFYILQNLENREFLQQLQNPAGVRQ